MLLTTLLRDYRDRDVLPGGWDEEFDWLRQEHAAELASLAESIREHGIRRPVLLGRDGRVWDGHHRLCVAYDLGITSIPVEHA